MNCRAPEIETCRTHIALLNIPMLRALLSEGLIVYSDHLCGDDGEGSCSIFYMLHFVAEFLLCFIEVVFLPPKSGIRYRVLAGATVLSSLGL